MSGACVMPKCVDAPTTRNRAGQDVCTGHRLVVVSGSYVDDRHTDGGHG